MKPIEPGCLVLVVNAAQWREHHIGRVFTVTGPQELIQRGHRCLYCEGRYCWPLSDGEGCCGCCLIRIDDDPDAVTEPEQHEVEA